MPPSSLTKFYVPSAGDVARGYPLPDGLRESIAYAKGLSRLTAELHTQAWNEVTKLREKVLVEAIDARLGKGNWTPADLRGRCRCERYPGSDIEYYVLDDVLIACMTQPEWMPGDVGAARLAFKSKIFHP